MEAAHRPQYLDFTRSSGVCPHAPVSGSGLSTVRRIRKQWPSCPQRWLFNRLVPSWRNAVWWTNMQF